MNTNDKEFKSLLDEMKKQGSRDLVIQALMLKAEREVAGEDNDKREKQLDTVIETLEKNNESKDESLKDILSSFDKILEEITGLKLPVGNKDDALIEANKEISSILSKSLQELSLIRKINEGSLEYDKESAQYRNTSGREIQSTISGKEIKKGGYVDFETASDRLIGQGKRVRESEDKQLYKAKIESNKASEGNNTKFNSSIALPGERTRERFSSRPSADSRLKTRQGIQEYTIPQKDKTFEEKLKEEIAATKQIFGSLGKGLSSVFKTGKGLFTNPKETFGKGLENIKNVGNKAKDIISTPATYSPEKERFAKEYERLGGFGGAERGAERFVDIKKEGEESVKESTGDKKAASLAASLVGKKEPKVYGYNQETGEKITDSREWEEQEEANAQGMLLSQYRQKKSGESEKSSSVEMPEKKDSKPATPFLSPAADKNEENDNFVSAQEQLAENSKTDLELTKEMLAVQKEQLAELKKLSAAFVTRIPPELQESKATVQKTAKESGGSEGGIDLDIPGKRTLRGLGKGVVKGTSGLLKFAGSKGGMIAGGALALGAGAYTAYKGYSGAQEEEKAQLEELNAKVQTGEITPEEAEAQKKQIGEATVEKKGGALGEGGGMAAGAIGGMKAGAALGATVGSVIPGVGTAIGAGVGSLAGGALGAFAGSKLGKKAGEFGGRLFTGIKNAPEDIKKYNEAFEEVDKQKQEKTANFFSGIKDKVSGIGGKIKDTYGYAKKQAGLDLSGAVGQEQAEQLISTTSNVDSQQTTKEGVVTNTRKMNEGVVGEKSLFGSKFLGSLFSSKGQKTGEFLTTGSDEITMESLTDSGMSRDENTTSKYGRLLGSRVSGGLFGRDKYSISLEGKQGEAEYDTQMTKKNYRKIQSLAKEGKYDEAEAKYKELKADQERVAASVTGPSSPEEVTAPGEGAQKGITFSDIGSKAMSAFKGGVDTAKGLRDKGKGFLGKGIDAIKGLFRKDRDDGLSPEERDLKKGLAEEMKSISKMSEKDLRKKEIDDIASGKDFGLADSTNMSGGWSPSAIQGRREMLIARGADKSALSKLDSLVEPAPAPRKEGIDLAKESVDNKDLTRESSKTTVPPPVVSTSVNNNNKNTFNPIKPSPRSEYSGSALDRYQNRIAVY